MITKNSLFFLLAVLVCIANANPAYAFLGGMEGMGNPVGLVSDESDFLTHPSAIAEGKGVRVYGHYGFEYRNAEKWDSTTEGYSPAGNLEYRWPYRTAGNEQRHQGLLGSSFPLGKGRMGFFLQYAGRRGNFSGRESEYYEGDKYSHNYDLERDLDGLSLRFIYGIPLGTFKLGGEIQLGYRQEKNRSFFDEDISMSERIFRTNSPLGADLPWADTLQFMSPFNSKYWEGVIKGGVEGSLGFAKVAFTAKGGLLFGDNKYEYEWMTSASRTSVNMKGNVDGWISGGDLWLRFPIGKDLSIPFLLAVEYREKTRDGDGRIVFNGATTADTSEYKNKEQNLKIEVGGGIDKKFARTRTAAGVYYGYFKSQGEFSFLYLEKIPVAWFKFDHSKYPDSTEHRVTMRLIGEKEVSTSLTLRAGLSGFVGQVKEDSRFDYTSSSTSLNYNTKSSLSGSNWGVNASIGSTIKLNRVKVEPFISGGFKQSDMTGDGVRTDYPGDLFKVDKNRQEWLMGGGLSILF